MKKELTICWLTNRIDSKFEWFFESLLVQVAELGVEFPRVIRIDSTDADGYPRLVLDTSRWPEGFFEKYNPLGKLTRVRVKPSIWQGPYRLTKNEYFAAANARNTGFALCATSHIAFVDDLSVLMPGWLSNALHAVDNDYVMAGAYKKLKKMDVETGVLKSYEEFPSGIDSRWDRGSDGGIVPIPGGGLFGCNFVLPLDYAIRVGGQDEIYDSLGGEDWDFGIRLERAGFPIFYNRNARSYESEELHHESNFSVFQRRIDKKMGDTHSSNILLKRLMEEPNRITPLGNQFTLSELKNYLEMTGKFPVPNYPTTHWPDGQKLIHM